MFGALYAKLVGAGLVVASLAGVFLWGHHVGASAVQARWNAASAAQAATASRQAAKNAVQTLDWTQQFAAASAHYETARHEPIPAVAASVSADVAAGSVRLRDDCPADRGAVPKATARARAADAAATAALAQRVADSIAAVRVGDAADARERQLRAQVIALQAIVRAERAPAVHSGP